MQAPQPSEQHETLAVYMVQECCLVVEVVHSGRWEHTVVDIESFVVHSDSMNMATVAEGIATVDIHSCVEQSCTTRCCVDPVHDYCFVPHDYGCCDCVILCCCCCCMIDSETQRSWSWSQQTTHLEMMLYHFVLSQV